MLRKGLPLSPESWGRKLASGESRDGKRDGKRDLDQTQWDHVWKEVGIDRWRRLWVP